MGMLDRITKAVTDRLRKPEPAKLRAFTNAWDDGREIIHEGDYKRQIEANKHWVYVCARLIANAVASTELKVYVSKGADKRDTQPFVREMTQPVTESKMRWLLSNPSPYVKGLAGVEDVVEVPNHPFLDLMERVNPFWNHHDLFYMSEMYQQLIGNVYWYIGTGSGQPEQVWLPEPQYMEIVGSKAEWVGGYVWQKDVLKVPFAPEEIVHFAIYDPTTRDPRYGRGPLMAAAAEYDIYEQMNTFDKALFENMARPEGVLTTSEPIDDRTFQRLKRDWQAMYGGASKAGKVAILDQGLTFEAITFSPRELAFLQGRETLPEVIMAVFGVPVTMVRVEEVRANTYAGERQFQKNTVLPRLRAWEEKINERLMPLYAPSVTTSLPGGPTVQIRQSPDAFVAFENPVPADVEQELKERELNLNLGVRTINEVRQEDMGLEPVPWGDEPIKQAVPTPPGSDMENDDEGDEEMSPDDGKRLVRLITDDVIGRVFDTPARKE